MYLNVDNMMVHAGKHLLNLRPVENKETMKWFITTAPQII